MKMVIDCPGCGKRYQVDASLAGKKSRCKDCGNSFRIPDASGIPAAKESASGRATLAEAAGVPSASANKASAAATTTIVFNCPKCFKQYEVDALLAGKKSRCKECKEVFAIPPAPARRPEPAVQPSSRKPSSSSSRNFAVIPEKSVPEPEVRFEFDSDDEPVERVVRRASPPPVEEEPEELGPRRIAYPRRPARSRQSDDVDTEVGVTVAGGYVALAILAFIILMVWHAAGLPGANRVHRVFVASVLILCFLGLVIGIWSSIWLLVIAFRDRIEQGIFCLVVPFYSFLYIFMRWRETRGIFAMSIAPAFVIVSFTFAGGFLLGLHGPTILPRREASSDSDGENPPQLVDEHPFLDLAPNGRPPGSPHPRFEPFEAHFARMRSEHGDRAVMLAMVGLPTNSNPANGVTKHEVEVAIDERLKALAPEASQSMSFGTGARRSVCLISVDDVNRLAKSIDFGKASRNGSRIDVVVSAEYIASVPRLATEPPIAVRPLSPGDEKPRVPANADALTKALAQLQSPDIGPKKDALDQIRRVPPNDRLNDVTDAVLPLLANEDEGVIKNAVHVLAVWQSPEAMDRLIAMVSDPRVFLRWDILKSLGKYKDVKAAEALVDRLKEDGHIVEGELRDMGSMAEEPLITLLEHADADVRRKACDILKFVGGSATLKAMAKLPPDADFSVRNAAQEAIKTISSRVPVADDSESPFKKKNKSESPFKKKTDSESPFKKKTDSDSPFKRKSETPPAGKSSDE